MHGRAGPALRMLAEAGVEVAHESTFPKIASVSAAFGAQTDTFAPPILVDGDNVICQSVAVAHYVGSKYGFPAPAGQESRGLMLSNAIIDLMENGLQTNAKDPTKIKAYLYGADGKPARFALMAGALERAVKGPFFFGEKPSYVDFIWGTSLLV